MSANQTINYFAQTDFRGRKTTFGIKSEDRARHVYVIGKTGMGKSCLLENMAVQDIKNGEGMAFIDPHGRSAELLLDFVPPERIDDIVYFAPFDLDYPISFNIMEDVGKDKRHLVANGLMSTFKKIWPDVWSARMEYILNNVLLALLEYPDSTLLGVNRMLSDKFYRNKVVDNISDPSVKSFWVDEFAKYNERYMQEAGDAIKNKIGQFTSNPLIRNIIGQPKSSFDLRQMMDNRKILIVNLSKGQLGEQNADLLGGMFITKIYLAAMSRAGSTAAEQANMPYFYLFVDEFQSFVNDSFADILAEARKYRLSLTIAHQYIEQMPETVRNAVFGNVGTTITFRVGPFDAEVLEKIFDPTFMKNDLVNLGFAQIYLTMMIDGVGSQPFSAVTIPPIVAFGESNREEIIKRTRQNYAHPRAEVEGNIMKWFEPPSAGTGAPRPFPPRNPVPSSSTSNSRFSGRCLSGSSTSTMTVPPSDGQKAEARPPQSPAVRSKSNQPMPARFLSRPPDRPIQSRLSEVKPIVRPALESLTKFSLNVLKNKTMKADSNKSELRALLQKAVSEKNKPKTDFPAGKSNDGKSQVTANEGMFATDRAVPPKPAEAPEKSASTDNRRQVSGKKEVSRETLENILRVDPKEDLL